MYFIRTFYLSTSTIVYILDPREKGKDLFTEVNGEFSFSEALGEIQVLGLHLEKF